MRGIFVLIAIVFLAAAPAGAVHADWASRFVVYAGGNYTVTDEVIDPSSIGDNIGQVTQYSDREGTYRGNFSNVFPKGTAYFAIRDIDANQRIAVLTPEGTYIAAAYSGPYPTPAPWSSVYFWLIAVVVVLAAMVAAVVWSSRRARN